MRKAILSIGLAATFHLAASTGCSGDDDGNAGGAGGAGGTGAGGSSGPGSSSSSMSSHATGGGGQGTGAGPQGGANPGGGPSCGGASEDGPSYSTDFALTESPISEDGAWTQAGTHWAAIVTENGIAHGTQTGLDGYDDSYAHLSGFPADQQACAVIHKGAPFGFQEVEIHMRWSDSEDSAQGYECFIHHAGQYAQIVRWNGTYGEFTYIADVGGVTAPEDGDVLKATAIGSVITLYLNDVQLAQATDATYATGDPGMGFFKNDNSGANTEFGFKSYTATGL